MDPKLIRPRARLPAQPIDAPGGMLRRRPRDFEEWKALVSWGKLPPWEQGSTGYQLRLARESARLTQAQLAARLGVSQQAVARVERWDSNPTVRVLESWARALGARLQLEIHPREVAS